MHEVVKMWVRPEKGGAMVEREALAVLDDGIVDDHTCGKRRHLTVVFADDWAAATSELGIPVEPSARRANVLVTGGGGAALVGSTIRIGEVAIEVQGITAPCRRMDEAEQGLQKALEPDARAGVWGRVRAAGTIRLGDRLTRADPIPDET
jgi:MOSC domain-containing protein YiiM